MKKTEDILERLKGQMPQVPDSDFLTESIMQAITSADNDNHGWIVPMWIRVIRTVSSVAALFFIALFIGLKGLEQEPVQKVVVSSEFNLQKKKPVIKDKEDAIEVYKDRIERRKQRQIRQTRIENLYAKF